MSDKKKNNSDVNDNFLLPLEKKKKIIGVFLIILSFISILSIFSYSASDNHFTSKDLFQVFFDSERYFNNSFKAQNWLGIFGALLANFLINSTIGFFSLAIGAVFFVWGWSILNNIDLKTPLIASSFLIALGTLVASLSFVIATAFHLDDAPVEIYGSVGIYLGATLYKLFGFIGSLLILLFLIFISFLLAFDINLLEYLTKLKSFISKKYAERMEQKENQSKIIAKNKKIKNEKENNDDNNVKFVKDKEIIKEDKIENEISDKISQNDEVIDENKKTKIKIKRLEDPFNEEELNPKPTKKDVEKREKILNEIKEAATDSQCDDFENLPEPYEETIDYKFPGLDLLQDDKEEITVSDEELERNAALLKEKLKLFDIDIIDITVVPGPVVTLYEIVPAPGVKISRIVSLEQDIALALAAKGIRIIAPIPGKSAIGVEIPNSNQAIVRAKSILRKLKLGKEELPLALGKDIAGDIFIADLAKMPHLLIAGSTGSGKSVGINMIITSLLYTKHPSEIKFVIIDPKKIELSFYKKLRNHYLATSPDIDEEIVTNPQNAIYLLKSVELEMEKRYDMFAKAGARHIVDYNKKVLDPKKQLVDTEKVKHHFLPYIVVIIDELADLMITSGKEVEEPIARLAQMARAVGIHLVVATQRPSVNVITGIIKANFPARIAYQVASKIDSRTILDMNGAEQLLGRGDMLFLPPGMPKPFRLQNAYISTEEVERITDYIYVQPGYSKLYRLPSIASSKKEKGSGLDLEFDEMFAEAARVIVKHQQGSVSLLQRKLKLGYSRAARIMDQLEEAGIVGPADGSKSRQVLVDSEEQLENILKAYL